MSASRSKPFSLTVSLGGVLVLCTTLMALDVLPAVFGPAAVDISNVPELDAGFRLLYELKFAEGRAQFEGWQKAHPQDSLGYASEAASYLFEECYRQGIMTSEFFLDDKRFLGKIPLEPDQYLRVKFFATNKQAQDVAQLRLKENPDNPNALFVMSISLGMQADYASLIDNRQLDSLKRIREADTYSNKLLKIAPDAADAYLGLGTANYIIGSLPGPKKFLLGFAGIHGDKTKGIEQLEIAANRGHYLRPFAKILLALTAPREKKPEKARTEFVELAAEFPGNPLFARELTKLNVSPVAAIRRSSAHFTKPTLDVLGLTATTAGKSGNRHAALSRFHLPGNSETMAGAADV